MTAAGAFAIAAWTAFAGTSARAAGPEDEGLLKTDSRAPYVHRLTLYDEDGKAINPKDEPAVPYSPAATCGKCHPIGEIVHGWHFNAPDPDVPAGRPGEPWILIDKQTGTVLPVSARRWPGTYNLPGAGLTNWQFVQRFGAHIPGGGLGEPAYETGTSPHEKARWRVSGALEVDCLFCHSADSHHDPAEVARQIEKENFRWAPTVALGLAVVRGEARKAPDDWDPLAPPNPDYPDQAGPKLLYDLKRFDLDDRVLFNITRRPSPERCYFCHSFREVGPGATHDMLASVDVHLAAGLTCVSCHRHAVDHDIVRGYGTEAAERKQGWRAAYSCEGCHVGTAGADDQLLVLGGRYRAPRPEHRGLPPLHFEKLTCTACHAGPWPETDAKRFQTALAHGLGLPARDRNDDSPPRIVGPVFATGLDGKVTPQRLFWPTQKGDARLADKPYLWSIGHDVRPAVQALGVHGCTDCHALETPLDFGRLTTPGEPADALPIRTMLALRDDEESIRQAWSLGFRFRPVFKWFGFACAGLVALILLRNIATGFQGPVRMTEPARERGAGGVVWLALVTLAATGFTDLLGFGQPREWVLLVHLLGAPLFVLGLTGLVIYAAPASRRCATQTDPDRPALQKLLFWLVAAAGLTVMFTMLTAMLPVFGTAGQATLVDLHRVAAWVFTITFVLYTIAYRAARRARGAKS